MEECAGMLGVYKRAYKARYIIIRTQTGVVLVIGRWALTV